MAKLLSRTDRRLLAKERKRLSRRNERRQRNMFTDKVKPLRLDVPGEDGAWFELRQVSGDQLDEASIKRQQRTFMMDISEGMAHAMSQAEPKPRVCPNCGWRGKDEDVALTLADCDNATLVRYGLVGWGGEGYEGEPVDGDAGGKRKSKLDGGTRDWAAAEIFRLSYVTVGEASRSETSGTNGANPTESSEPSALPSPTPQSTSAPS
jgi:hypothetical protein